MNKKLSEEKVSLLAQLWNTLPTVAELAGMIGCNTSCANKYAKRLGLPHHQRKDQWTAEREEQLRTLWEAGTPRAEIGRIMHLTSGMIMGKVHRMKLARPVREKPVKKASKEKVVKFKAASRIAAQTRFKASLSPEVSRGIQVLQKPETGSCPPPSPAQSISGPEPLNIPLLETGYRKCKYIKGQDDKCCGHPVAVIGKPYCDYHHELCHVRR